MKHQHRTVSVGSSVQTLTLKLTVVVALAGIAFGASPKIAPELREQPSDLPVRVIVQFRHRPTDAQHRKVIAKGGSLRWKLHLVNGGAYSIPAGRLEELANDPEVVQIVPDREVHGATVVGQYTPSVQAVGAPSAWQNGLDGTGIGIAVIDSGISLHTDLNNSLGASRIVYNQNFVADGVTAGANDDLYGHGTHVAGIIAGSGYSSSLSKPIYTYKGIAPNATLVDLRVLDSNGSGNDSNVIAAVQTAIQLKNQYNIRVINLSLGRQVASSYTVDPLCQAVESAWRAGIFVVVAAGNQGRDNSMKTSGYGTITAPGNDPYVMTVGAMKDEGTVGTGDDQIASYSSKGPTLDDHIVKPDIVAPGNRIVSLGDLNSSLRATYPTNIVTPSVYTSHPSGLADPAGYYILSGTSMAAPVVSGAGALLFQNNPALTPDQVKARLMKTASKQFPATSVAIDPSTGISYTSQYDIFTIGAGYLNIPAALSSTDLALGSAASPVALYNALTQTTTIISPGFSAWATSPLFSTNIVWGTSVFINGTTTLWGANVVWGTGGLLGFNVIWGTNVVWGTGGGSDTVESTSIGINGEN